MYIRYLGNIHNLLNYFSIVKGGVKDNCIHLTKEDSQFTCLEFLNTDARDYLLNQIWLEIEKGSEFFDMDDLIKTYYDAKRYNL